MFSSWLSDIIIKKSNVPEEDIVVLKYGLLKMFMLIEDIIFTLVLGLALGIITDSIIFQISFMLLRLYAGGYHSKTEIRCKIHSVLVTAVSLTGIRLMPAGYPPMCFIMIMASLIIGILSPVEAKNKPLSETEKEVNYKKTIAILIMLNLIAIIDLIFRWGVFYRAITIVVSGVGILVIAGEIDNRSKR